MKKINFGDKKKLLFKWLNSYRGFLVFLGAPGIGKTYFCAAIVNQVFNKMEYRYWTEPELFSSLRNGMDKYHGEDYYSALKHMLDRQYIILDDIGSSGFTQWRTEVLFNLIDLRYKSDRPTILTSNLTKEQLIEGLGPRAASRIFAKDNFLLEIHNGKDLRQIGK